MTSPFFYFTENINDAMARAMAYFERTCATNIRRDLMRPGHTLLEGEICWGDGDGYALFLINSGFPTADEPPGEVSLMVHAAWHNRPRIIFALAREGQTPDMQDSGGNTALHYAVFRGNLDAVKALLTAGADPEKANNFGLTPLQMAEWCAKDQNACSLEGGEAAMQYRSPIAAQLSAVVERREAYQHQKESCNFFMLKFVPA